MRNLVVSIIGSYIPTSFVNLFSMIVEDIATDHLAMSMPLDAVLAGLGLLIGCAPIVWWVGTVVWRKVMRRERVRVAAEDSVSCSDILCCSTRRSPDMSDRRTDPASAEAQ